MTDPAMMNCPHSPDGWCLSCVRAELDEYHARQVRQSDLLRATADALHGGPMKDGYWSWHDLPTIAKTFRGLLEEIAEEAEAENDPPYTAGGLLDRLDSALEATDRPQLRATDQPDATHQETCVLCAGSGRLWMPTSDHSQGPLRIECENCGGTGKVTMTAEGVRAGWVYP
jgi:hypothetical protein